MTNAEKFKEVFGSDLEESRMLSMPSSFNQIIALKSFQIEGVDCADEWKESEYQGEPTIPLSVIEKIKANIDKLPDLNPDYPMDMTTHVSKWAVFEIIDKAVKEIEHE